MVKVNEMEVHELLEKAVDFIRNNGMLTEWLEEYDLDPSYEAREKFWIYENEEETPNYFEDDTSDILDDFPVLDEDELISELKEFDCQFEFLDC